MITGKRYLFSLLSFLLMLVFSVSESKAQQDPLYSQYQFNQLVVNPGYAGSAGALSLMFLTRQQWSGFEGAPQTQTFTAHAPVTMKHIGLGLSLIHDNLGPVNQMGIYFDYSFRFHLNATMKMSLGLKGGFNHMRIDYAELNREVTQTDPAYYGESVSKMLPNVGFGIYISHPVFYFGASSPKLISNTFDKSHSEGLSLEGKEVLHYFVMAGGMIPLSDQVQFKPSFTTRLSGASPPVTDFNMNVLLFDKLWLGGMYRIQTAAGGMIQFQVTPQLKIGYVYEMSINKLQTFNRGTHEFMLGYEFSFSKSHVYNPRHF